MSWFVKRLAVIGRTILAAAAALGPLATTSPALGSAFSSEPLPVPVSIDGERIQSSMFLQVELERYGIPFDAFSNGTLDSFETAFRDFVLALRAGDPAKLAVLRPGDKPQELRELISRFQGPFDASNSIKVVCRVRSGAEQIFVWEWSSPSRPVRRGFSVEASPRGIRVDVVYSARPLETLIVDALQWEALHPQAAVRPRGRYNFTFPAPAVSVVSGQTASDAHRVALQFDGEPLNIVVNSDDGAAAPKTNAASTASAVSSYIAAYRALKERNTEAFCAAYTPKSAEKLRAWFKKMKPEEFKLYYTATTQPRVLRFVLDADPLALVFYTVGKDPQVHYDYMVKSETGYKLTNAYFEGFLDDVLGNAALFPTQIDAFLKNIVGGTRSG